MVVRDFVMATRKITSIAGNSENPLTFLHDMFLLKGNSGEAHRFSRQWNVSAGVRSKEYSLALPFLSCVSSGDLVTSSYPTCLIYKVNLPSRSPRSLSKLIFVLSQLFTIPSGMWLAPLCLITAILFIFVDVLLHNMEKFLTHDRNKLRALSAAFLSKTTWWCQMVSLVTTVTGDSAVSP